MQQRRSKNLLLLVWLAGWTIASMPASAQTAQTGLSGTVEDPSGRGIPQAVVELQQQETSWRRTTQTGSAGTYSIAGLPIGTYSVRVSHPAFSTSESNGIQLLVGQERTLDFKLKLAGRPVQVEVSSSVSEIDQTSATIQGRMVQTQIEGLPINGRNWSNLLPLIAGATDSGTSDQRTVRFAGHGRDDNNITFDGVDATGISNQPQKTGIRLAIPASAIAEFKVDSTLYTSESADGTGVKWCLHPVAGLTHSMAKCLSFFATISSMHVIHSRRVRNLFASTSLVEMQVVPWFAAKRFSSWHWKLIASVWTRR